MSKNNFGSSYGRQTVGFPRSGERGYPTFKFPKA